MLLRIKHFSRRGTGSSGIKLLSWRRVGIAGVGLAIDFRDSSASVILPSQGKEGLAGYTEANRGIPCGIETPLSPSSENEAFQAGVIESPIGLMIL